MRLALCISGSGTTAEAILRACLTRRLTGIEPVCLIASRPDAGGIERAKALGVRVEDIVILHPKNFVSREDFGAAMLRAFAERGVQLIGQYGWIIKTPQSVIKSFPGRAINQHPGPLDSGRHDFGGQGMFGRRVHAARIMFAERVGRDFFTEATAHRVEVEYDTGKVIKRKVLEMIPGETVESLQARLLPLEHEVQIEALRDMVSGNIEEFVREKPLVLPGEELILEECKRQAIAMYPHG